MNKVERTKMVKATLVAAKAQHVATLTLKRDLVEPGTDEGPVSDLAKPGFYFLTHDNGEVYARFYVGRQRKKCGMVNAINRIKRQQTLTGKILISSNSAWEVHYLSVDKMKGLTTAHGKGKIAAFFTKKHKDAFQNLEEMNRILNDHFVFQAQKR